MTTDQRPEVALQIRRLCAYYGASAILHGIDLDVYRGEIVALLGRNGAGRTTTLRSILGLVDRRSGSVKVRGTELIDLPINTACRTGLIGYCPEERGIYASLNVEENLVLPPILGPGGMPLEEVYELFPRLKDRRKSRGDNLSGGEQQMLALARILRTGATLLLLDEITEGLAPVIVEELVSVVEILKSRGLTILIVEQNLRFVSLIANRGYILESGRIVYEFGQSELIESPKKVTGYLSV